MKITNQGIISNIIIPDNASPSTENTNNGTIGRLEAKKPIKLLSGTGVYNSIYTGARVSHWESFWIAAVNSI